MAIVPTQLAARLAAAVRAPADLCHLGRPSGCCWARAAASCSAALPAAAGARAGRRGRPGQLQRLPALFRRLPVSGGDDGRRIRCAARPPARAGQRRPVRELRHLRRRLPVGDAVSGCRRSGHRHRHADAAGGRAAPAAERRPGGTCPRRAEDRRLRLPRGRRSASPGRARHGLPQPAVCRTAAAILHRVRAARWRRWGADQCLRARRLRIPARLALDSRAHRRNPRTAPAGKRAARPPGAGLGRRRGRCRAGRCARCAAPAAAGPSGSGAC
jgi:hypothetical protein